jgi:type IV pilus assembly protein PilY1
MNMNPIRSALFSAALVVLSAGPEPVRADDAEIYVNTRELPEEAMPLVMFSLDYRPNLGATVCTQGECDFLVEAGVLDVQDSYTFFDMLRAALKLVMEPLSGVRVGLMLNHNDMMTGTCAAGPAGAKAGCGTGGYIAMGFREFQENDTNGAKAMFHSILATIPAPGDSPSGPSHSYQGRELFYEFYRYLTGATVWNGMNGFTSFDHNNGDNSINLVPEYISRWAGTPSEAANGFGWDPTVIDGAIIADPAVGTYSDVGRYISPLTTLGDCSKIYTINFMFQVSNQEDHSDDEIARDIGLRKKPPGVGQEFAKMVEYLNRTDLSDSVAGDQKVTSYFLGQPPQVYNNTFAAYAQAGGTGSALPITENPEELVAILSDIFKQILSVSTTFTSAALPVNTFDRAQVLRDVFLALFQPQVDEYPAGNSYWWGNVKKLRLEGEGTADDVLRLVDANGNNAIAADGRITYSAVTFWTDPLGADVLDAGRDPDEFAMDGRDGRSVNRGGAGHKKPGYPRHTGYNPDRQNPISGGVQPESGPRRIFYDSGPASLAALEATDAVVTALQPAIGAADVTEAMQVVKFMRGLDPIAEDPLIDPDVVPMLWMFGAVMHSRPLIVNYGARDGHTVENPLIYIAAGGNDGALRYILNTSSSGVELGQEIWSFVPTEVMSNVRSIVKQEGPLFSGESTIYGFDGPGTLFTRDLNGDGTLESDDGDRAIIYAGLRRGGRGYYALDVSDPMNPNLLWRIVGGETPGFERLGLAFSQPQAGLMDLNGDGVGEPVVIFAGGYDRQYDNQTGAINDPDGRAIYIVNGLTGALVFRVEHAQMLDSISSTVAAVDTAGDGLLDRIVVGDLGGRIWRVDMTPVGTPPENWTVSLLADLGRHAAGEAPGGQNDRRFHNQPDVVQSKETYLIGDAEAVTVKYDAVLIGTGDRENPLYNVPNNWFFMVRDLNTGILTEAVDSAYVMADLTDVTWVTGQEIPQDSAGWRLQLTAVGEKNLAPALTVANTVFFTTYLPPGASDEDVCGPAEGTGRLYTVSLKNANPPSNRDQPIDSSDSTVDPSMRWEELAAGGIPSEVVFIPPNRVMAGLEEPREVPITTRWRTFWYLEEDPVR